MKRKRKAIFYSAALLLIAIFVMAGCGRKKLDNHGLPNRKKSTFLND